MSAGNSTRATDDALWLQLGVERVLYELASGRGFLQQHAPRFTGAPPRANYFESLKSSRRLALVSELKLRWDIEKVFDELKNKFKEQQVWASTPESKSAQAPLIALTHNLLVLLEEQLRREGIVNEAEIDRRQQVLQAAQIVAHQAGRLIPSCVVALQRLTQRSVKLLRAPHRDLPRLGDRQNLPQHRPPHPTHDLMPAETTERKLRGP